ncbi:MAG: tetratricopeptide repeat protein [Halobacteriovoraceae bacterium]|nr:tetratricopeptide repeat protein [Halobacteriovoraceae bacterium]
MKLAKVATKDMGFQLITLLFFLSFSMTVWGQGAEARRKEVLSIIDEEIHEVNRLSRQYKGQNPSVLFRKSELYLEKGRLIKEEENEKYLSIPPEKRKKTKKNAYFKTSYSYFQGAKKEALTLIKKFPRYERSADVYYILGFNEKEFGSTNKSLEYLHKAEKMSKSDSRARVRAQNALAEIYYNKKEYKKAINYYEKNLKETKDRWWTKDAFNLAWSYFRVRNYDRAIKLMIKVEDLSKRSEYIDMSNEVQRDIGLFYAESGRTKEGVEHYKKYNKDYSLELITLAAFLKQSGKYAQALTVLTEALKLSESYKNKIKIYLSRIELFDKYEKTSYHLKDCIALYKITKNYELEKDQFEIYKYQVKKQIGKLQKQIANPTYKKSREVRQLKVRQVVSYLTLLKALEPSSKDDSYFYMAETYYQADDYEKAIDNYEKAYQNALEKKDKKIIKLSMEGMLAAIGVPKSKFPKREQYYYKVYNSYLSYDPRSKKSQEIYKRLYKYEFDRKNPVEMKKLLNRYAENFPKDSPSQEKMINSLIEIYNKQKDSGQLALLMSEISEGKYSISKKAKNDLTDIYQKIEAKKVEGFLSKGDYSSAAEGYLKIYSNPRTSKKARSNAAYNLMIIYFKAHKLQETYGWGVKALSLMDVQDFYNYRNTFLTITKYLFDRMQFAASADLSHRGLGKICKSKTDMKKKFFDNAIYTYIAANNLRKVSELRNLVKPCSIPSSSLYALDLEVLRFYLNAKDFNGLDQYVQRVQGNNELAPELLEFSFELYRFYETKAMFSKANFWKKYVFKFYDLSSKQKKSISVNGLDAYAYFQVPSLKAKYNRLERMKLSFPEKTFNNSLQRKLKTLEEITNDALKIQNVGSGYGIYKSFEYLLLAYKNIIDEINNFVPPGKSPEYVKSFRSSMNQISGPLQAKTNQFMAQARASIKKNVILTNFDSKEIGIHYNMFEDMKFFDYERLGER